MSSNYDILCVSHNPAIRAAEDIPDRGDAVTMALRGLDEHPDCDLLIARYSGALAEVGCPRGDGEHHPGWHRDPIWADAALLRVVAAAASYLGGDPMSDPGLASAVAQATRFCWTPARLHAIRRQLGVPDGAATRQEE
jgi:hypothetical protein